MTGFRMTVTRAELPAIDAAAAAFDRALEGAITNEHVSAAAAAYNAVLRRAVDAICEDTKHINTRPTIRQALGKTRRNGLLFGHNPPAAIRMHIRKFEGLPGNEPI